MTARDPTTKVYAGFDGGGTRTSCVLCDPKGSVLGVGSGGPANYHNRGVDDALASLRASFDDALARSRVAKDRLRLEACFGLAGLDSPKDFAIMRRAIRSMTLAPGRRREYLVENDWRTAVTGAFIDSPGVVLIAGTGCVAAAQRDGEVVRVGGWGLIVDDRGSGYDIGRDALYAAMRDYDRRGPKTKLLRLTMSRLDVREPQGIIERVYIEQMPPSEIASLSILVSEAARSGDAVATKILDSKARILGELVVSAASRLDMLDTRFGVFLNGGVFKAGPPLLVPLEETIRAAAPKAVIVEPKLPPACGAVVLLLQREGAKVDGPLVKRMRASLKKARADVAPSG
jgi:N-acetylglucosamine kinase-like BadF-type ATPase